MLTASLSVMDLDEPTSKHCIQVLRMREGDRLVLTDGRGLKTTATLREADKRRSSVSLEAPTYTPRQGPEVYIGISPVKNNSRLEWFLEKAAEIGVAGITPLICERTERISLRIDRLTQILVSAMLQSQQTWLPLLEEPKPLEQVLRGVSERDRFIAHCIEDKKTTLRGVSGVSWLLIGPEGDFTAREVTEALTRGWIPVTLGDTRLRTETAGIVGGTLLRLS
jgi:16S rRNA (uracil1498-N3)-methyltransferase